MQEPIYNNGTVKVAKEGVSAYLAWYRTLSMADAKEISDVCSRLTKEAAKNAGVDLYDIGRNTFSFFGHQTEENWEKQRVSVSEKCFSSSTSRRSLNSLSAQLSGRRKQRFYTSAIRRRASLSWSLRST